MSLQGQYEPDNIFAKILAGEIPSVKVFEDEECLAFMDLYPQSDGHTLVIPKAVQSRNILDFPTDRLGAYMQRVQRVARAVEAGLKPDGIILTQFNGAPAGQSVFHLHFHIIPRYSDQDERPHATGESADPAALQAIADRIRAAME